MRTLSRLLMTSIIMLPILAGAKVPQWQIVSAESKLDFIATQNNAPVKGHFTNVSGDIDFSPEDLKQSKVDIVVDMNSVNASYQELVGILKMSDWLNIAKFPKASFTANELTKVKENVYQAKGDLQIRDKKLPLTVDFTLKDYSKDKFQVQGEAKIKRTAFGVGQGDWASTDEIKDDVTIHFDLIGQPKK